MANLIFSIDNFATDEQVTVDKIHGTGVNRPFADKRFRIVIDTTGRTVIIKGRSEQVSGVDARPNFQKISAQGLHLSTRSAGDQARENQ